MHRADICPVRPGSNGNTVTAVRMCRARRPNSGPQPSRFTDCQRSADAPELTAILHHRTSTIASARREPREFQLDRVIYPLSTRRPADPCCARLELSSSARRGGRLATISSLNDFLSVNRSLWSSPGLPGTDRYFRACHVPSAGGPSADVAGFRGVGSFAPAGETVLQRTPASGLRKPDEGLWLRRVRGYLDQRRSVVRQSEAVRSRIVRGRSADSVTNPIAPAIVVNSSPCCLIVVSSIKMIAGRSPA